MINQLKRWIGRLCIAFTDRAERWLDWIYAKGWLWQKAGDPTTDVQSGRGGWALPVRLNCCSEHARLRGTHAAISPGGEVIAYVPSSEVAARVVADVMLETLRQELVVDEMEECDDERR